MYKLHLILKYLRKRRIAWVSLIAVTLCTAMVLVVISVMGGWLRMFKQSFHGLTGDIIVHGESLTGFPDYQEMADKMRQRPEIAAVVPTIETFGLININNKVKRGVAVYGYPIQDIGKVNAFPQSLYLQYQKFLDAAKDLKGEEKAKLLAQAAEHATHPNFDKPLSDEAYHQLVPRAKGDPSKWPGMILGCGVLGIHKEKDGSLGERPLGLYENWVKLDVLGISPDAASPDVQSDKSERNYWIADDSRTQIWQSDTQSVYVPFDVIQSDLKMEERTVTNVDTGKEEIIPARTRDLQVAVKPGIPLEAAKKQIELIVEQVQSERAAKDRAAGHEISRSFPISVETWEESQELFINAIEKEKALVTFLFGIVSIVAIFCIFCIFYMIVVEKTRDIGIIKSCGATSTGVAGIFLGYGLAIGIVGASCGFLAGYLIVHNINFLHTEMGKILGIQIWNPEVYAFDTIPNTMDPFEVAIIVLVAIMSSVLGSLIPAIVAARKNPIECLRFE